MNMLYQLTGEAKSQRMKHMDKIEDDMLCMNGLRVTVPILYYRPHLSKQ